VKLFYIAIFFSIFFLVVGAFYSSHVLVYTSGAFAILALVLWLFSGDGYGASGPDSL